MANVFWNQKTSSKELRNHTDTHTHTQTHTYRVLLPGDVILCLKCMCLLTQAVLPSRAACEPDPTQVGTASPWTLPKQGHGPFLARHPRHDRPTLAASATRNEQTFRSFLLPFLSIPLYPRAGAGKAGGRRRSRRSTQDLQLLALPSHHSSCSKKAPKNSCWQFMVTESAPAFCLRTYVTESAPSLRPASRGEPLVKQCAVMLRPGIDPHFVRPP